MSRELSRNNVARLFTLGAFACGVIGLIVGIIEREWRLSVTGWFTGGILLAVLALTLLADEYAEARRKASSSQG